MEETAAAAASSSSGDRKFVLNLPSGYHFCPTEAELIVDYLRRKIAGLPLPLPNFIDECIIDYHPEQLIDKYKEFGENRWFFFTKRQPRYENGYRPNRTTPAKCHWRATGSQRGIKSGGALVGRVRTLVFYDYEKPKKKEGMAPAEKKEGMAPDVKKESPELVRTNWTMYEYENVAPGAEAADPKLQMNEWVLCSIQKKQRCDDDCRRGRREEEVQEGSPAAAGGRKRKRKGKPPKAPEEAGQGRQTDDHTVKSSPEPTPPQQPSPLEIVLPPDGGDDYCNVIPNMVMGQDSYEQADYASMIAMGQDSYEQADYAGTMGHSGSDTYSIAASMTDHSYGQTYQLQHNKVMPPGVYYGVAPNMMGQSPDIMGLFNHGYTDDAGQLTGTSIGNDLASLVNIPPTTSYGGGSITGAQAPCDAGRSTSMQGMFTNAGVLSQIAGFDNSGGFAGVPSVHGPSSTPLCPHNRVTMSACMSCLGQ